MILLSEILLLLPEITLLLFAFVILFTDMFTNKQNIGPTIASFGVGISALSVLLMYLGLFGSTETSSLALANIISVDHYSLFFKLVMLIVALSLCLCSISLFDEDVKSKEKESKILLLILRLHQIMKYYKDIMIVLRSTSPT
jgi:NADH:ubiquinone oxidoreductase subunit 2 (subunit N)